MQTILSLTLPFFAVIGLGLVAAKRGMLGDGAVQSLNVFVFYFAMPAMLVRALSRQPLEQLFDPLFFACLLAAGLAIFLVGALLAALLLRADLAGCAIAGQSSAHGNIGFLGLPLTFLAFGDTAAGPASMALMADMLVLIPLTLTLLEIARGQGGGFARLLNTLKGVIFNPFLLSIVAGLVLSIFIPGQLPQPIDRFLEFLGAAAGPAALFALGGSLAGRPVSGDFGGVILMTVMKLVAHPIAVWAVLTHGLIYLQGAPARADWVAVAVTMAALPIASNIFVIADRYQVFPRRVSTAILISTALGVLSVAVVLNFFGR